MTHRFILEMHETDEAFKATLFFGNESKRISVPKEFTSNGRQVQALSNLFKEIREVIGRKAFPRDTLRFTVHATASGVEHRAAGYADDTEPVQISNPEDV